MSENKEKGKSLSAQDLLTRLKKKPENNSSGEKKSSTYKDFLEKRNKEKEADGTRASGFELKGVQNAGSVYDEVYAEPVPEVENEISLDAAAAAFFENDAAESAAFEVNDAETYGEFLDPDLLKYPQDIPEADYSEAEPAPEQETFVPEVPREPSYEELFPELTEDYSEFLPDLTETYTEPISVDSEPVPEESAEPFVEAAPEDFIDEYREYLSTEEDPFVGTSPEELAAYADAAGMPMAESFEEPEEIPYAGTYSEMPVVPVDGEYYDDVIPDDDFFDNDPIEDYTEESYDDTQADYNEEYSEEQEFENLVAEVTGGAPVDELDETDISLMVALGMEDELAKTMGEETATQLTDDYVADQEEWVDRSNRFGADEYSDLSQNEEIMDTYRKRSRISLIKMLIALVVAGVLLFFENLAVMGLQFDGALDPAVFPVVHIMVDLQILLVSVFVMGTSVLKGFGDMLKFRPSVDCLPALLTAAAVVNSILTAIMIEDAEPRMFNFGAAFCLLLMAINEYMTVRREMFSFTIVSSHKPKFVMRRLSQRDSIMETEAVADMDTHVGDDGDIIKIQKTDFVDGYFWRTKEKGTCSRSVVGLAIVISVILAVTVGIYAFVKKEAYPINIGFYVLSAAIPATMVVAGFYPFYRANRRAFENDSTIIGEGSVEEYSGVGVISFDDVNVFPSHSVKVRNVRLFNNSRIDKVLYYAASVFSATGGPLADVFEVATMETGHSDNVTVLETGSGYIEADVNGKSIMFGKAQALAKHGILIPDDIISENVDIPADCSVIYMIYQRKLVAKMIVNYVLDPDFEYVLKQLTGSGMCVCVKTFDPSIDEELILRQLPQNNYAMRVIKYKNTEEITKYSQRAEGGIVSRDNTKALLHTVASCDKILSAQKAGFAIGIISAIINAVLVAATLMSGQYQNTLFSLYSVLIQIFWLLPVVITTKLIVR